MGCCIALALLISMVRTAWYRVVHGREPERTGFAPPARRPAPAAVPALSAAVPALSAAAPALSTRGIS